MVYGTVMMLPIYPMKAKQTKMYSIKYNSSERNNAIQYSHFLFWLCFPLMHLSYIQVCPGLLYLKTQRFFSDEQPTLCSTSLLRATLHCIACLDNIKQTKRDKDPSTTKPPQVWGVSYLKSSHSAETNMTTANQNLPEKVSKGLRQKLFNYRP